jgi:hypothetical protein
MKKIEGIIIGLFLIMATAFTIVSAEAETTYYCYTNGEWGTCSPSEAILAQEAMTKETPREVTHDEFNAIISSHEPFWDHYFWDDDRTATPTVTPLPTPVQAETEITYYCFINGEWRICTPSEVIIAQEAMTRETPRSLSRDEMNALLSSREPFRDYYTPDDAVTPAPTLTPVPTQRPTPVPTRFWESIIKNRVPSRWLSRSG